MRHPIIKGPYISKGGLAINLCLRIFLLGPDLLYISRTAYAECLTINLNLQGTPKKTFSTTYSGTKGHYFGTPCRTIFLMCLFMSMTISGVLDYQSLSRANSLGGLSIYLNFKTDYLSTFMTISLGVLPILTISTYRIISL